MDIIYNKNPLRTQVLLTDEEVIELWYKIKVKEMQEAMFSAHFNLTQTGYIDHERAVKYLNPTYWLGDDNHDLDERIDTLTNYAVEALKYDHCGDCTCVASSCDKCYAEDLVGVNTIPRLGKHSAYKIDGAFGPKQERTIDEAIEHLARKAVEPWMISEAYKNLPDMWDRNVPRWRAEYTAAAEWLTKYKHRHF